MKVSLKVAHSLLKVFWDSGMAGMASLMYHPSAKVVPLPLLILLSNTSTMFFSSQILSFMVK